MRYYEKLQALPRQLDAIRDYLSSADTDTRAALPKDATIGYTVFFKNGITLDVTCYGIKIDELHGDLDEENDARRHAFSAAILSAGDSELVISEPRHALEGEWSLEYDGNTYTAEIVRA